jgi:hypothetical protein
MTFVSNASTTDCAFGDGAIHVFQADGAHAGWAKRKGLGSLLTFKVVDANRPKPLAKTEANLSPRAASVLARVRGGRRNSVPTSVAVIAIW